MNESWDVLVIGGGPAGMLAAGVAAERGQKVLLLEKNAELGRKLRITGGGRCNITNATFDTRTLLSRYEEAAPFLFSAFAKYSAADTLSFFNGRGLDTKVEAENRVFPISDKAEDVATTLETYLKSTKVTVRPNTQVLGLVTEGNQIVGVKTSTGTLVATSYILATGGTSRPETGSTGDGYGWLTSIGHQVTKPLPSLVPITVHNTFVKDLAGITLTDTTIAVYSDTTQLARKKGKVLFTHEGLSGPGILNFSNTIREALKYNTVTIKLNLVTDSTEEELQARLKADLVTAANRKIKNVLDSYIFKNLVEPVLVEAKIDSEKLCNAITRQERDLLIKVLRGLTLHVRGLLGPEKAIVASGGVELNEIDFKTMRSRLFPNLFVIGDMLNIKRPSGGYSLQLCWTTGFVAGSNA